METLQITEKVYRLKDLPFNKGYFWSYDFKNASLPLSIIVYQVIENGSYESLIDLVTIFDKNEVFNIYNKTFRPTSLKSSWLNDKDIIVFMDIFFDAVLNGRTNNG
jgi:hypothetical protein